MSTPTARTLDRCRKVGMLAHVVEKWIPQTRQRKDAFGFGDVLATDGRKGALLIQATSGAHVAERRAKIIGECADAAARWVAAGNHIQVWGWSKQGAATKRKLWTLRIVEITELDLRCPCLGDEDDPGPHHFTSCAYKNPPATLEAP